MAIQESQTADAQARVTLPKAFAKAKVILEQISETEVRIRKAGTAEETGFAEEAVTVLSDRDRDRFLQLLDSPPAPNPALRDAMLNACAHRGLLFALRRSTRRSGIGASYAPTRCPQVISEGGPECQVQ